MHASVIAVLHSAALATLTDWEWQPAIVAPLALTAVLYARGVSLLWRDGQHRGAKLWQVASFACGWLITLLALVSPMHALSEQLFSAHMVQHELLMVIAAPLLVLGRPMVVMLWGLPRHWRPIVGGVAHNRSVRSVWAVLTRPFDAWLIHGIVIWLWHVPVLFQATLQSEAAHAAQHISFVATALLFWWAIIHPARRAALGMSVVYLFTTAVHTGALGALMSFARTPWYPEYASRSAAWGLTPLGDQQLAGMIMWIPASLVYLVAALLIVRRWLGDSEWAVTQRQRASFAVSPR